jgi:hypothetical protein
MNVIPFDRSLKATKPGNGAPKRHGFWQGLARTLDAIAAYPSRHVLSEQELRRVDDEIGRCRQLMFKAPHRRRDPIPAHLPVRHAIRAMKVRP